PGDDVAPLIGKIRGAVSAQLCRRLLQAVQPAAQIVEVVEGARRGLRTELAKRLRCQVQLLGQLAAHSRADDVVRLRDLTSRARLVWCRHFSHVRSAAARRGRLTATMRSQIPLS